MYVKTFESFSLADDKYKHILYHGTDAIRFSDFKIGDNRHGDAFGKGIYFTDNIEYAEWFGDYIKKCEIVMYNPFNITLKNMDHFLEIRKHIKIPEEIEAFDEAVNNRLYTYALSRLRYKEIFNNSNLEKMGYDGIIAPCERGGKEYIVFSPMQVNIIDHDYPLQ